MRNAKRVLGLGILSVLALMTFAGCAASGTGSADKPLPGRSKARLHAKYVHAVFFTAKPDTPAGEIDALIQDGHDLLAKIPCVRRLQTGRRDPAAVREFNDKEYTVGLLVLFDDKQGYDEYEAHPLHQQYVEKHKPHWADVRVCDFVAK